MTFAIEYIGIALGITSQDWEDTGLTNDPATAPSDDIDETTTRITALLLIRICAWIMPRGMFTDLSTTTMCRSMLVNGSLWPEELTEEVIEELKEYVKTILLGYNEVPYHNFKHCYHVTISVNKLVNMIVHQFPNEKPAYTFGFRDDPLMQFGMLFSALIHDVDHRGIPNRILASEDGDLAIKYNDQSIAENESLFIGFSELLKKKYDNLRRVIFPEREDYRRFRGACVNLVLTTDIASPERTQLGKTKWKEAFGVPYETVERKVMKKVQRHKMKEKPEQLLEDLQVDKPSFDSSRSLTSCSSDDELDDEERRNSHKAKQKKKKGNREALSGKALKFHRRLSQVGTNNGAVPTKNAHLGFRRSMDLTGELIETYGGGKRVSTSCNGSGSENKISLPPPEKIDDLRETVIMETIIKSADVAHNLQGFDQMAKWSDCLYLELRKAYVDEKGDDPSNGWFNNQNGFLDFYLLPLARKLDDTGAFGDIRGGIFASIVEENRMRWTTEGMAVTMKIIKKGNNDYPSSD
mmetsp:Transcript_8331/g.17338  ORF Transcript_8331/g.17338 Transcript_8331/m.17338 type:complete len:523 (+) Transcript_8331:164-1732(+)|eukprot:CAMPEP_0201120710 /NCGR_PEP_ID=MMETSP0850-20130426/4728_1 /ASSEMBLY_ACC=CAM_ASM_000622 /TAXON_ID=183588 /ORGANISM="Pseudo-nitzschia fraudulenta, Strain WWA7" /LENGTH=522 /DNA_ID=CAMNT_0047386937 /DNA_START=113 /DNA_END=1681 /DNA_ORIENTATION=+